MFANIDDFVLFRFLHFHMTKLTTTGIIYGILYT